MAFGANVSETGTALVRGPQLRLGELPRSHACATRNPPSPLCVSFPGRHTHPRGRDSVHGAGARSTWLTAVPTAPTTLPRTHGSQHCWNELGGHSCQGGWGIWCGQEEARTGRRGGAGRQGVMNQKRDHSELPPRALPRRGPGSPVTDRRPPPSSAWGWLGESSLITCSLHLAGTARTWGELGTNLFRATQR